MAGNVPVIVMIQGDEPGRCWQLQETRVTTAGRSSRNAVSLLIASVSRFHCEISYINGLWHIADLNSKKGTFVNNRRINQREVLRPGDLIRLSTVVFRFDLVAEDAAGGPDLVGYAVGEAALDGIGGQEEAAVAEAPAAQPEQKAGALGLSRGATINAAIVIGGAAVTIIAVLAALGYARSRARTIRARIEEQRTAATSALQRAELLADAGPADCSEALSALKQTTEEFAGMPQARAAAERYRALEAQWLDAQLVAVTDAEARGDYSNAFQRTAQLRDSLSNRAWIKVADERATYTLRLASAAYTLTRAKAKACLARGDKAGALALYQEAIHRIGSPQVVVHAKEQIDEISGAGALPAPPVPPGENGEQEDADEFDPPDLERDFRPPVKEGVGDEDEYDTGDEDLEFRPPVDFGND